MIRESIEKLSEKTNLSESEAKDTMLEIMQGEASEAQIAAYLMGLRLKGETVDEILGSVKAMRSLAQRVHVSDPLVVDTCGTGGDKSNTFNISTAAAFVVAGGGMTVAKHGNRSVSSRSGSADVLNALGVTIDLPIEQIEDCVNDVGIGFLFAPLYHGAMRHCAKPRAEMGIRTMMNVLGPLSNPANASIQILGVYRKSLTEKLAQVLIGLGTQHCFVTHGLDGLDEITITGPTYVSEGKAGRVSSYTISPMDFDLETVNLKEVSGGSPEDNARIIQDVLRGKKGPRRDIVLMNAAPAFVACGKVKTLQEGYLAASQSLDSGAAYEKLEKLIQYTKQHAS
ncbi:MAG: anthranilate phosphoribosyltransferase [Nitrospirales bacterium]|nr:anthranilate phosphoribosyltransferase [Nitrospira sp.]MDR4502906.1 anthranilate phosphoribosyltransferase [Nitrospirales bacterium]